MKYAVLFISIFCGISLFAQDDGPLLFDYEKESEEENETTEDTPTEVKDETEIRETESESEKTVLTRIDMRKQGKSFGIGIDLYAPFNTDYELTFGLGVFVDFHITDVSVIEINMSGFKLFNTEDNSLDGTLMQFKCDYLHFFGGFFIGGGPGLASATYVDSTERTQQALIGLKMGFAFNTRSMMTEQMSLDTINRFTFHVITPMSKEEKKGVVSIGYEILF